jgi:hypothetical protein
MLPAFGFLKGNLNPAPTIADSNFVFVTPGVSSPSITHGVSWSAGQELETYASISSSPTVSAVAGSTDDDTAGSTTVGNTPKLYRHWWTINGGALDATIDYTLSGSSRLVFAALVFAGAVGRTTAATANSGTALLSPSFTVTGGPRNFLALSILGVEGSHKTNPPAQGAGWTLLGTESSTDVDEPSSSDRSTLAIAYRSYAIADLSWDGMGNATVPAMQWTATDYVAQPWNAISVGILS